MPNLKNTSFAVIRPLKNTLKMIKQDRIIFADFSADSAKAIFYSNPNSGKKFAKLYLIFQKLDHLTCNKILELV